MCLSVLLACMFMYHMCGQKYKHCSSNGKVFWQLGTKEYHKDTVSITLYSSATEKKKSLMQVQPLCSDRGVSPETLLQLCSGEEIQLYSTREPQQKCCSSALVSLENCYSSAIVCSGEVLQLCSTRGSYPSKSVTALLCSSETSHCITNFIQEIYQEERIQEGACLQCKRQQQTEKQERRKEH